MKINLLISLLVFAVAFPITTSLVFGPSTEDFLSLIMENIKSHLAL